MYQDLPLISGESLGMKLWVSIIPLTQNLTLNISIVFAYISTVQFAQEIGYASRKRDKERGEV